MKNWIREWLGMNDAAARYRHEMAVHREEIQNNLRKTLIEFSHQMLASNEAELRDRFAMALSEGLVGHQDQPEVLAEKAYRYADAMIIQRKK